MLLGAALQELKILKSKLVRLYQLRENTFNILENRDIEVDFDTVTAEINDLIQKIRALKVKIVKTNAQTLINVRGTDMSIMELILMIGDLRSELSQYTMLRRRGPVYLGGQAVEYISQKNQNEVAQTIALLEEEKAAYDKILQSNNWKTQLLE